MESGRSDLARAAGESSATAVTETISAWTGQKKTKIQSTPTSGENSSGKIVGGQEQEREELEGLDWDDDKLVKEIDGCLRRLKDTPFVYYGGNIDDESFAFFDDQQLRVLNQRLALCRIRALEEKYQDMDDETLSALFPPSDLEANEYYLHDELSFEWYFDPVYCQYVHFQDYQRLMLRNNGEYEDWECYRSTCSTLEGDQEYVQFWEKLTSNSELIEWYVTRSTYVSRIERLLHYHTLKIATVHPHVYKTLVNSGCTEFFRLIGVPPQLHFSLKNETYRVQNTGLLTITSSEKGKTRRNKQHPPLQQIQSPNFSQEPTLNEKRAATMPRTFVQEFRHRLEIDFIWSRPYADFLFEMWKLLTGEKLSFKDALMRLYNDEKYSFIFAVKAEFEPNLRPLEKLYKPLLARISAKVAEEAKGWIMDYVTRNGWKPKTYYDYVKKKLGIARKIGLIPSPPTKAPHDKAVHGHTLKQGIGSKEE